MQSWEKLKGLYPNGQQLWLLQHGVLQSSSRGEM